MSAGLARRRRLLIRNGRSMVLSRGATAVTLLGFPSTYVPETAPSGIQQGDMRCEILNDEIAAASWPAPPRHPDKLKFDGNFWTVQGATPVYDGSTQTGWSLWIRGN